MSLRRQTGNDMSLGSVKDRRDNKVLRAEERNRFVRCLLDRHLDAYASSRG